MTSLVRFPTKSDAFSEYRPSTNAYNNFLLPQTLGKRKESGIGNAQSQVIAIDFKPAGGAASIDDQIASLIASIPPLLSGKRPQLSFQTLSSICRKAVSPPFSRGEHIYNALTAELERTVASLAREGRGSIMSREGGWLQRLKSGWDTYEANVALLASVFVYLDRVHVSGNGLQSIQKLATVTFKNGIWDNDLLYSKTRDDVLAWSSAEREASAPDPSIRPTITAISSLAKTLSEPEFWALVGPYLEFTTNYYTDTSNAHVQQVEAGKMSATRYVEWALEMVTEERDRADACFDSHAAKNVVFHVRDAAGSKQGHKIVQKALDEAMDAKDADALTRLYRFCEDCDLFELMVKSLRTHIEDRTKTLISDPANDANMIDGSLELKRFADGAVMKPFSKESPSTALSSQDARQLIELQDAIRVGFKAGMGSRQNAPAEWIAKHLDVVMRRGQGSGTEAQFNSQLDEIIALVGFTRDKDVFKAFYSTQLAKRLLLSKSASDDMERNMIVKLQNELGEEFTSGDVMMKDLALSETLVKSYQSAQSKNPSEFSDIGGQFTANVLTESAWPAYPLLKDGWSFKLTPELQASIDQFTAWYSTQHKNRQLSWRWQLATVSLSARFPSGKYEIGVSLFQAVVMIQFNEEDTLSFKDLKDRTGIEQSELVRIVQSLALGRKGTRVLLKKPPGKEIQPTDIFAWNKGFQSDRIKFRINQIQQDMSAEEDRKTNEQIVIDRVSVLEAVIVRIMKARKKLTLQLLIDQVVTDVSKRFPPDVKEIKKRMENLIEREFLKRDEEDRNLLHYLA